MGRIMSGQQIEFQFFSRLGGGQRTGGSANYNKSDLLIVNSSGDFFGLFVEPSCSLTPLLVYSGTAAEFGLKRD